MDDWINTFDRVRLQEYCAHHYPRPKPRWWRPGSRSTEDGDRLQVGITVPGTPVEISYPAQLMRRVTRNARYDYAAWRWLEPLPTPLRLADLPALQVEYGLDHYTYQSFLSTLCHHCWRVRSGHEPLKRWIDVRRAKLDYLTQLPRPLSDDVHLLLAGLERRLLHCVNRMSGPRSVEILEAATRGLKEALTAVGHAVGAVFSGPGFGYQFTVNLMVPTVHGFEIPAGVEGDDRNVWQENKAAADDLWAGLGERLERKLVVVAETGPQHYAGFWAPAFRDRAAPALPGATLAYQEMRGSAVFREDLPRLERLGQAVEEKWRAYMMSGFRHRLFVSLPVLIPGSVYERTVGAVVNTNVIPNDDDTWLRAYHARWLALCNERVQPFARMAFWFHLVRCSIDPSGNLGPMTGSPLWDTLVVRESQPPLTKPPAGGGYIE